ncbi:hypothetical protein QBC47DRAFT_368093 [Echria macrotheca]|uniref:Uncharacterized protein n=1 Tax=Echria macrotheca TaxID=438768 RepID=A0AAJ0BP14_9PEZI|nr:hypothetical protein QBC47DRAFT_368093 [Echria macrotheca]
MGGLLFSVFLFVGVCVCVAWGVVCCELSVSWVVGRRLCVGYLSLSWLGVWACGSVGVGSD